METPLDLWPEFKYLLQEASRAAAAAKPPIDAKSFEAARASFRNDVELALYLIAGFAKRWSGAVEKIARNTHARGEREAALGVEEAVLHLKTLPEYARFEARLEKLERRLANLYDVKDRPPFMLAGLRLKWDDVDAYLSTLLKNASSPAFSHSISEAIDVRSSLEELVQIGRRWLVSAAFAVEAQEKKYAWAQLARTPAATLIALANTNANISSREFLRTYFPAVLEEKGGARKFDVAWKELRNLVRAKAASQKKFRATLEKRLEHARGLRG